MLAELSPGAGSAPAQAPLLAIKSVQPSHRARLATGLFLLGRLGRMNGGIGFCIGLIAIRLWSVNRCDINFRDLFLFYRYDH